MDKQVKAIDDALYDWIKSVRDQQANSTAGKQNSNASQSNSGGTTGGTVNNINISNPGSPYTSQPAVSISASAPKTKTYNDVAYVVVKQDGTKWLLCEDDKITPRQMINLCKFITIVNEYHMADLNNTLQKISYYNGMQFLTVAFNWSTLIENFGIEDHFIQMTTAIPSDVYVYTLYD